MRLATANAVLTVLGIQTSPGALSTAESALDATFPDVQESLETSLVSSTQVDYFDLGIYQLTHPKLRLSNSFVSKDDPVTVTVGLAGEGLLTSAGLALASQYFAIDFKLGTVALLGTYTAGKYVVSVSYTSGFSTGADADLLDGLPTELVQAGVSKAAAYAMLNPANIAKDKAKYAAMTGVTGLDRKGSRALQAFTRPRGTYIWPSHSVAVE